MRANFKNPYITDADAMGRMLRYLREDSYKGKAGALVRSFLFWKKNHPSISNVFTKQSFRLRGNVLRNKILRANQYPNNYIHVKYRYPMLDYITFMQIHY